MKKYASSKRWNLMFQKRCEKKFSKFPQDVNFTEATDPRMDRGKVKKAFKKDLFVERKFHFWNRTSINESPPGIAPVHKYPEKSPFSFELSLHKPKAMRAPRLRLRFEGLREGRWRGRGWAIWDLLVEVLELLELEALYRCLDLLL